MKIAKSILIFVLSWCLLTIVPAGAISLVFCITFKSVVQFPVYIVLCALGAAPILSFAIVCEELERQ